MKALKGLYMASYNTVCVTTGLWLLTDEWNTFFGYLLIAEGFLWTIEYAGHRNKVQPMWCSDPSCAPNPIDGKCPACRGRKVQP